MRSLYKYALMALAVIFIYQFQSNRFKEAEKLLDDEWPQLSRHMQTPPVEETPPEEKPVKAVAKDTNIELKPQKSATIQVQSAPAPQASSEGPPKLKPGHVMFEVKMGNWVVTHGDVLLGKIKGQPHIKTGQYKPQNPRLWPSAKIPYVIDEEYPYVELVQDVIDYFHEHTPIRFVNPKLGDKDGIIFKVGEEHCYSYLGRVGGFQPIFLAEECRGPQIIHEVLHALGFIHEQSRTDRDSYLEVLWQEIQPDYHMQFMKVPSSFMIAAGKTKFDYNSVMLYHPTAFAKDPSVPVMKSTTSKKIEPTREGLSEGDIERLYQLYGP